MAGILSRTQSKVGAWVGSMVVHLGDSNVPNALLFIDKYTQVCRILNPVVIALQQLPVVCRGDAGINKYVTDSFGGVEAACRTILLDFFRFAFDGSGAAIGAVTIRSEEELQQFLEQRHTGKRLRFRQRA